MPKTCFRDRRGSWPPCGLRSAPRHAIEAHIELLIAHLDQMDGDADAEPDADDWIMTSTATEDDEPEGAAWA